MICKIISIRINSYPQDDSSTKDSSPNFNSLSVQTDRQFSRYKLNNTLTNFTYLLLASTFPILYGLRKDFKLDGTPIRVILRSGTNPYHDRKRSKKKL